MAGMPVTLKDAANVAVEFPAAAPVAMADQYGDLTDSEVIQSSAVTAVNDNLFLIDCRASRSIVVDFITGSGWSVAFETSIDGNNWRTAPVALLSRPGQTIVANNQSQSSQRFSAETCGGVLIRVRVTTVGTGTFAGVARKITTGLPAYAQQQTASMVRIVSAVSGVATTAPGVLMGGTFENTTAAKRYVHFYSKSTTPVLGTDTPALSVPLLANTVRDIQVPRTFFGSGLAWAITTDFAAGTGNAATASDVVGYFGYFQA